MTEKLNAIHELQNTQDDWETRKNLAHGWFRNLQDEICQSFEEIEKKAVKTKQNNIKSNRFVSKKWNRENTEKKQENGAKLHGGGEMRVMRGQIFEKVGVNVSKVEGIFSDTFAKQIPGAEESGGKFWASGISLVAHMCSPLVPAVHMNTRMIVTSKGWFGGGADLTPMYENDKDTVSFHNALKGACERHDKSYPDFKKWCDEYFFLPHRNEPRGVGGIFYDYQEDNWDTDFAFTKDVGLTFKDIYCEIVEKHMHKTWTEEQREHQLIKRGRYVEFNLLHDRGTMFGLKTGGNTEAILMSMPPEVKWP